MSGLTRLENINLANITNLPVTLSSLRDGNDRGFGTMLKSLGVPASQVFTGLTSSVTQVAPHPGWVFGVIVAGADVPIIYAGSPAAGEVRVTYDAAGVPTLLFKAAVTAYTLLQAAMPDTIAAALDFAP